MEIMNAANSVIVAGGERRGALLFGLPISHGDIIEFLDKKLDLEKLTSANISVVFNEDPEDFFRKVKKDEEFELLFRGKVLSCQKAKDLWYKILTNSLKSGEPGILNGYLANRMSNMSWVNDLTITNPCGEVWLSVGESCCLGSLALPRFIMPSGNVDWEGLRKTVEIAVRFLDDVITVNNYPLPYIAETCKNLRRIGIGVMGLHDMLLLKGLRYNSDEGLEFVDRMMNFIKNEAYLASSRLAAEKGSFPFFETDKFLKSNFVKTLKPSIRSEIKTNGMRGCGLLSIAPTGTISLISGFTQGIESLYAPATLTRYRDTEGLKEKIVIHPLFKRYINEGKDISHFQGVYDLSLRDHFEMQRICQKHLDNSCSKTINVKQGVSPEELSELYMEYIPELKGCTVYPEGSRENQPLTALSLDDAIKYAREGIGSEEALEGSCRLGGGCG
jgi:ribonucleoside-diphosphate reductase alpha chain